jgi:hypothetical protein
MPGRVLRPCDSCKRYHASYIVFDPKLGGKAYVCYDCWAAEYAVRPPSAPAQEGAGPGEPVETEPSDREEDELWVVGGRMLSQATPPG